MTNFTDILDRPASAIEAPKALPVGTYTWVITGLPKHDKSAKKQTPYVEFPIKCLAAGEDVDQEALNDWMTKASGDTRGLDTVEKKLTFYITEDSAYRLKDFLVDDLGLDETEYENIRQMTEAAPGQQFLGTIKHTASQDGKSVYAEIGATAPLSE
jgi:hypothetical protein